MRFILFCAALVLVTSLSTLAAAPPCAPSFSFPQADVTAIAVDDIHVYFSSGGYLLRAPKSGGAAAAIAKFSQKWIMDVSLDETNVYFLARDRADQKDSIYALPKGGGPATILLRAYAARMIPDGEWLYIAYPGSQTRGRWNTDGSILRVKKDGSALETLADRLHMVMGMLLDGDSVYFSEGVSGRAGGVKRVSKSGGAVSRIADVPGALMLTHDQANLYVFHMVGSHEGGITSISKSGGGVKRVISGIPFEVLTPLEVIGDSVYFGRLVDQKTARLEAVRPATGQHRVIAEFEGGFPRVAVDSCGIYHSTVNGVQRSGP